MGEQDGREMSALREAVAVMRELGVTEWGNIKLGPVPQAPPAPEDAPPAPTPEEQHRAYWARVTRASGAPIPPFRGPK